MGSTACTEPQCLHKGALYLFLPPTATYGQPVYTFVTEVIPLLPGAELTSLKFWPSERPLSISPHPGRRLSSFFIFMWQMSCFMLSSHLYLGLPCDLLVRGFQLNIFLTVLVSGILCT